MQAGQVIKVPVGEDDDGDEDIVMWTRVFEDVVREMLRDPRLDYVTQRAGCLLMYDPSRYLTCTSPR